MDGHLVRFALLQGVMGMAEVQRARWVYIALILQALLVGSYVTALITYVPVAIADCICALVAIDGMIAGFWYLLPRRDSSVRAVAGFAVSAILFGVLLLAFLRMLVLFRAM